MKKLALLGFGVLAMLVLASCGGPVEEFAEQASSAAALEPGVDQVYSGIVLSAGALVHDETLRGVEAVDPMVERALVVTDVLGRSRGKLQEGTELDPRRGGTHSETPCDPRDGCRP